MKLAHATLRVRKGIEKNFLNYGSPVKLVHACFVWQEAHWSSFYKFGGPIELLEACLCVRKDVERNLHHCGGSAKLVHASLSVKRDARSYGFPVKLVHPTLRVRKGINLTQLWRSCEAHACLFGVPGGTLKAVLTIVQVLWCPAKLVLPLWMSSRIQREVLTIVEVLWRICLAPCMWSMGVK